MKESTSKAQLDKFAAAQREHETEQSQEHFNYMLKKVAKAPKGDEPNKAKSAK